MTNIPSGTAEFATIEATVSALYRAVSFAPGEQPDWDRLRSLFLPRGTLVPPKAENESEVHVLDVEAFIGNSRKYIESTELKEKGFYETEVARRTESFGNVTHVFSTCQSRYATDETAPFWRGINSIQLVWDGGRWWVASVLWDMEQPDRRIPEKYLRKG